MFDRVQEAAKNPLAREQRHHTPDEMKNELNTIYRALEDSVSFHMCRAGSEYEFDMEAT